MRYAVALVITGRPSKHVVEMWVENVPDDVKGADVVTALESSTHAPALSAAGVFMANRRTYAEARLPKGYTEAPSPAVVAWSELVKAPTVQMNLRVPAGRRAAWQAAAGREGLDFSTWVRRALDAAAGA